MANSHQQMTAIKIVGLLFITFLVSQPAIGQKKNALAKSALSEIESLIANPFEFLGKTPSDIQLAGRPASIKGCDQWEVDVSPKETKDNPAGQDSAMVIGTGCGALTLLVSAKTGLVYAINFLVHRKARLEGMEIWDHLKGIYEFEPRGVAFIPAKDNSFLGLQMLQGGIVLVAFESDKKAIRFME